jgi:type 1 fimbria pilin
MKTTVWIVLTAASVLCATAAGATNRVTIQIALNVATAPCEPAAGVQLAAGWQPSAETSADKRRLQASDHDVDLDEYPTDSHRKLMPGQKPGTNVTGSPSGYDAKRLNRLWGRFNGAKPSAKAEKVHKSNGGDVAVRPGRWAR